MQGFEKGLGSGAGNGWAMNPIQPPLWERLASGLAAVGTFAFFFSAVGYGWYSLLLAMAR
ncbi:MAG: hypothetical protein Tsb0032_12490 [Kiloniellaceae bacterium]